MRRRTVTTLLFTVSVMAAAFAAACGQGKSDEGATPPKTGTTPPPPSSSKATITSGDTKDGGSIALKDAGVTYDGPTIGALFMQTPVMSDMDWPKEADRKAIDKGEKPSVMRIGYIRQGQRVPVIPEPHVKSNCKEGWYELVQGGFVCGKYATLDTSHPRLKIAPHPPDMGTPLPYQYGYNITHGTPLYKTIPSRDERMKLEPWLAGKPKPKAKPKEEETASTAVYGEDALDAGALTLAKSTTTASTLDPFGLGEDALDAGTPWYMREYTDGGKPLVTLDELKGEGSMSRRMVKGFYIALDKELNEKGRWWKSTYGLLAPFERIYVNDKWSKFHGIWLNEDPATAASTPTNLADGGLTAPVIAERKPTPDIAKYGSKSQVAVILYYKAAKYIVAVSRKAVTTGDPVARHTLVRLTGDSVVINGARYDETDEGWWMKASEGNRTDPGPPPKDLAPGEKWIDVNLKTQMLVAYEGDKAVFVTAVSTGRENKDDKEKDHRTPPGTFRIREKHIAATMDGDHATDGPYSIEDVPWIMYFNGSYALHGAFWHSNFGREQSHGCVNLAPSDAKTMFNWTEPHLPENWHGVWATSEKPGTRVVVHCGKDKCKEWPDPL